MTQRQLFSGGLAAVYFLTQAAFAHAAETNFWSERRRQSDAVTKTNPQMARLPAPAGTGLSALPAPARLAAQNPLSAAVSSRLPPGRQQELLPLLSSLPQNFGQVRDVAFPKKGAGKIVLHIQDIHQNAEAQDNIRQAVAALAASQPVHRLALEGAFENIDFAPYRDYPHPQVIQAVADYFLRVNKITGPVHAALTGAKNFPPVVGVDDRALYDANVDAYRRAAPRLAQAQKALAAARQHLADEKKSVFSPGLARFDESIEDYRAGRASLAEHSRRLAALGTDMPPAFRDFLKALAMETALDFSRVERERAALLDVLVPRLTPEDLNGLLHDSTTYRLGQMSYGAFYRRLAALCRKNTVDLAAFPSFNGYLEYALLADRLLAEDIFDALNTLERGGFERLAKTPAERALIENSRALFLLGKLVDFSLTPAEWTEYRGRRDNAFLAGLKIPRGDFEDFYDSARRRDELMAENLSRAFQEKKGLAVLVTGGFHAQGMKDLLTARGFTVVSYVPKITRVEDGAGSAYLSVFTREKTPLEKLFETPKLSVSQKMWPKAVGQADFALHVAGGEALSGLPKGPWRALGQAVRSVAAERRGESVIVRALLERDVAPSGRKEAAVALSLSGKQDAKTGALTIEESRAASVARPFSVLGQTAGAVMLGLSAAFTYYLAGSGGIALWGLLWVLPVYLAGAAGVAGYNAGLAAVARGRQTGTFFPPEDLPAAGVEIGLLCPVWMDAEAHKQVLAWRRRHNGAVVRVGGVSSNDRLAETAGRVVSLQPWLLSRPNRLLLSIVLAQESARLAFARWGPLQEVAIPLALPVRLAWLFISRRHLKAEEQTLEPSVLLSLQEHFTPGELLEYEPGLIALSMSGEGGNTPVSTVFSDGLPAVRKLFTADEFRAVWPDLLDIIGAIGENADLFLNRGLPAVRHLIHSPADLRAIGQELATFDKEAGRSVNRRMWIGLPSVSHLLRSREDLRAVVQELTALSQREEEPFALVTYGLPAVKHLIQSREDIRVAGKAMAGLATDSRVRRYRFNPVLWYGLPAVGHLAQTLDDIALVGEELLALAGSRDREWIDPLFRYGFPAVRQLIRTPQDIQTVGLALERATEGMDKETVSALFKIVLPRVRHAVTSPADLSVAARGLATAFESAGPEKALQTLDSGFPLISHLIASPSDIHPAAQELLALADKFLAMDENIPIAHWRYFTAALQVVAPQIQTLQDLADRGQELLHVLDRTPGVEIPTLINIGEMRPLADAHPGAWNRVIKPIVFNQTQGAFLCLRNLNALHEAGAIQTMEDLYFIRDFITAHGHRAHDLLENFLIAGVASGAVGKPVSREQESVRAYLAAIPYGIPEIYEAYKKNPGQLRALAARGDRIVERIRSGDAAAVQTDPFFPALLMHVFPPTVTTQRKQYMNLYRDRPDRPKDTKGIPAALKSEPRLVRAGHLALKDPAQPLDTTPWRILLDIVREGNKPPAEEVALSPADIAGLGHDLITQWSAGDSLARNRAELLARLYKLFRHNQGQTLPESLGRVENILALKEFLADTLRDLVGHALQAHAAAHSDEHQQILQKMFMTKIARPGHVARLLFEQRQRPEAARRILHRLLRDAEAAQSLWDQIKDLDSIDALQEALQATQVDVQPGKEATVIAQVLQGDDYKKMQGEINAKYEFQTAGRTLTLRFEASKRKAHGVAGFNMGVCVVPDKKLWNNKGFMNVLLWDENGIAQGGMHMLLITDGGKTFLVLPGINPSPSLLSRAAAEDVYDRLMEYAHQAAKALGAEAVLIPTASIIHSNRSEIERVIAGKGYERRQLSRAHDFSYDPYAYQFQEVFVVPAPQTRDRVANASTLLTLPLFHDLIVLLVETFHWENRVGDKHAFADRVLNFPLVRGVVIPILESPLLPGLVMGLSGLLVLGIIAVPASAFVGAALHGVRYNRERKWYYEQSWPQFMVRLLDFAVIGIFVLSFAAPLITEAAALAAGGVLLSPDRVLTLPWLPGIVLSVLGSPLLLAGFVGILVLGTVAMLFAARRQTGPGDAPKSRPRPLSLLFRLMLPAMVGMFVLSMSAPFISDAVGLLAPGLLLSAPTAGEWPGLWVQGDIVFLLGLTAHGIRNLLDPYIRRGAMILRYALVTVVIATAVLFPYFDHTYIHPPAPPARTLQVGPAPHVFMTPAAADPATDARVRQLIAEFKNDSSLHVRNAARVAELTRIGRPAVLPLWEAVRMSPSTETQLTAINALMNIALTGERAAVEALCTFRFSADPLLNRAVEEAVEIVARRSVDTLLVLIAQGPDAVVRQNAAAHALRVNPGAAVGPAVLAWREGALPHAFIARELDAVAKRAPETRESIDAALLDLYSHPDPEVRLEAARLANGFGTKPPLSFFQTLLMRDYPFATLTFVLFMAVVFLFSLRARFQERWDPVDYNFRRVKSRNSIQADLALMDLEGLYEEGRVNGDDLLNAALAVLDRTFWPDLGDLIMVSAAERRFTDNAARSQALKVLGRIGDPRAVLPLLKISSRLPDANAIALASALLTLAGTEGPDLASLFPHSSEEAVLERTGLIVKRFITSERQWQDYLSFLRRVADVENERNAPVFEMFMKTLGDRAEKADSLRALMGAFDSWLTDFEDIQNGLFDPRNERHLAINFALLSMERPDVTWEDYQAMAADTVNGREKDAEAVDARFYFLAYEARLLADLIEQLEAMGPVLIVKNLRNGEFILAPIEEALKRRPRVRVTEARSSSTRSHADPYYLPQILSDEDLKYILEQQPYIVVIDSTKTPDHYTGGSAVGYPNWLAALHWALLQTDENLPASFQNTLREKNREAFVQLRARVHRVAPGRKLRRPYRLGFWNPSGRQLLLPEGKEGFTDVYEPTGERAMVVVQSALFHHDIVAKADAGDPLANAVIEKTEGARNDPSHWDDRNDAWNRLVRTPRGFRFALSLHRAATEAFQWVESQRQRFRGRRLPPRDLDLMLPWLPEAVAKLTRTDPARWRAILSTWWGRLLLVPHLEIWMIPGFGLIAVGLMALFGLNVPIAPGVLPSGSLLDVLLRLPVWESVLIGFVSLGVGLLHGVKKLIRAPPGARFPWIVYYDQPIANLAGRALAAFVIFSLVLSPLYVSLNVLDPTLFWDGLNVLLTWSGESPERAVAAALLGGLSIHGLYDLAAPRGFRLSLSDEDLARARPIAIFPSNETLLVISRRDYVPEPPGLTPDERQRFSPPVHLTEIIDQAFREARAEIADFPFGDAYYLIVHANAVVTQRTIPAEGEDGSPRVETVWHTFAEQSNALPDFETHRVDLIFPARVNNTQLPENFGRTVLEKAARRLGEGLGFPVTLAPSGFVRVSATHQTALKDYFGTNMDDLLLIGKENASPADFAHREGHLKLALHQYNGFQAFMIEDVFYDQKSVYGRGDERFIAMAMEAVERARWYPPNVNLGAHVADMFIDTKLPYLKQPVLSALAYRADQALSAARLLGDSHAEREIRDGLLRYWHEGESAEAAAALAEAIAAAVQKFALLEPESILEKIAATVNDWAGQLSPEARALTQSYPPDPDARLSLPLTKALGRWVSRRPMYQRLPRAVRGWTENAAALAFFTALSEFWMLPGFAWALLGLTPFGFWGIPTAALAAALLHGVRAERAPPGARLPFRLYYRQSAGRLTLRFLGAFGILAAAGLPFYADVSGLWAAIGLADGPATAIGASLLAALGLHTAWDIAMEGGDARALEALVQAQARLVPPNVDRAQAARLIKERLAAVEIDLGVDDLDAGAVGRALVRETAARARRSPAAAKTLAAAYRALGVTSLHRLADFLVRSTVAEGDWRPPHEAASPKNPLLIVIDSKDAVEEESWLPLAQWLKGMQAGAAVLTPDRDVASRLQNLGVPVALDPAAETRGIYRADLASLEDELKAALQLKNFAALQIFKTPLVEFDTENADPDLRDAAEAARLLDSLLRVAPARVPWDDIMTILRAVARYA